jgi:DNA-binding GntR family transcriptional regulator
MQHAIGISAEFKTREQVAYEGIRAAIVDGRLDQGTSINVSRLADEIGVSRITVGNALKRLSGEGFVLLRPHREAIVAPLDPGLIREIYLMRAELEALGGREEAAHITDEDLAELIAINEQIAAIHTVQPLDVRSLRATDLVFHRRVRQIARMPLLSTTLENLADRCEAFRARLLDARFRVLPAPYRHTEILDALAARDPERAASALRQHILDGMEAILEQINEPETRPEV